MTVSGFGPLTLLEMKRTPSMPDPRRLDLLAEPLFSVTGAATDRASLAAILALLSRGDDLEFRALQPHQQHAWHAFLVQLAALALHRRDLATAPREEEVWRSLVLALTGDAHEAWCLVVPDLSRPAFFQPPVPDRSLQSFKTASTPDSIDTLVTTRNHDIKRERMVDARPEHWAYALVSLQTMEGYTGAKNYGIARMNSGYGSRPAVSTARSLGRGRQFLDDVAAWRGSRDALVERFGYPQEGGAALLWTLPWDGETSLGLEECDPFFLEICRRVRLEASASRLVARVGNSKSPRIAQAEHKGATGDAWTPIRRADGAVLTLSDEGFSYKMLQRLIASGEFELPTAARLDRSGSGPLWLLAKGLVRGQKTEGYHERLLPIPPTVRRVFASLDERERLGRIALARVDVVSTVQRDVLRPSLCALLQDGAEKFDYRDRRLDPWLRRLDLMVDPIFFPRLWEALEQDSAEASDEQWAREVLRMAEAILEEAFDSLPLPAARRPRAVAQAERIFHGAAWKRFEGALATTGPSATGGAIDDA
jgi:CRISPR system Cascade subunit CasA